MHDPALDGYVLRHARSWGQTESSQVLQQTACLPGSSRVVLSSVVLQETRTPNILLTKFEFPGANSNLLSFASTTPEPSPTPSPAPSESNAPWVPSGSPSSASSSFVEETRPTPSGQSGLSVRSPSGIFESLKPGSTAPPVPSETSTTGTGAASSSETSSISESQGSITAEVSRSTSSPLPIFPKPPEGFSASSIASLGSENTIITTMTDGQQTNLPIFLGQALYGIGAIGTYFNLPGISGGVNIPCIIGCTSNQSPSPAGGGSPGASDTSNDPDDDDDNDDNDDNKSTTTGSTTSTAESCTSATTQTVFPESAFCSAIPTSIKGSKTTTTTCSTSTMTSTTVGCDVTATEETRTATVTPELNADAPLTMEVYTVLPPSSTTALSSVLPSASSSASSLASPPPLTYELFTVSPPSSSPVSSLSSSPASSRTSPPPLTYEVFTVLPPSSTPASSPVSSPASPPPLTYEVFTVTPPFSSPVSSPSASPASSRPLTYEVFTVLPPSSTPVSTPKLSSSSPNPSTTQSSGAVSQASRTSSPVKPLRTSVSPNRPASSSITPTPTPTPTEEPSITCHPKYASSPLVLTLHATRTTKKLTITHRGKPSLVCECTESETKYFTAPPFDRTSNVCGYTTNPTSTIVETISEAPTFTGYTWTDSVESIVKSCDTATEVRDPYQHTTCDDPVPISTLHPQFGTATLHVWEAWETNAASPKVIIAAVMNDTDQVMVADQREAVEVNLGTNVTIPVTNLESYPINIEPIASVEFLDEGERRRSLDKRIVVPPRPYPVDHSDLVFYVNGFKFNSVDDSEDEKGQEPPYCSVGDWDFGSAADQLADFLGNVIPIADLVLGAGKLPLPIPALSSRCPYFSLTTSFFAISP
ncbi:hypothetical protein P170DRAFT_482251 [Aspergillus steynii IBT 23096]|uniref:Uncharacterized protein n=1 Tax=Aspergillus steynii IBT 23096 TaxID=1392250 RepID=A0A2I2GMA5_9EURO|nr:uncharacterized protein P170DRAFT_482251 [Aspergillus steynii IBT 23096]PLB54007.1 hypothetical protein P170DRAFT_482251 [Aspergillus steynii IBT 23096]